MYGFLLTPAWLGRIAAALAIATVMVLLGGWQLSRYEDRSAINDRIDAAEAGEPAPLAEVLAGPGHDLPADAGWALVTATGRYEPAHEVLIRGRSVAGRVGFEVVTPLVLGDGSALLVDRGWIPPAATASELPVVPPAPAGQVTVTGRIRPSESSGAPVEPHNGVLQTRRVHLPAISPHLPFELYGGYLQLTEQDPPADPALTPIPPRRENSWLNAGYAAQWWIFAGMVLVGTAWLARREAGRRQAAQRAAQEPAAPAGSGDTPAVGADDHGRSALRCRS